jgi:hypothetical protein
MKLILTLSLTFIANCMIGQNYQCITSDQINYFGTNTLDNIVATRTDSIQVIDGDSIFYSFKTPRFDEECPVTVAGPWFGDKLIIKPDGQNIFFNKVLDSVFIETNAHLNDTFLVYTYPTGEWIKGTVNLIEASTILGEIDSVKTIDLFSNSLEFDVLTPSIKLGKNSGFVQIFSLYDFPAVNNTLTLVGSEFPRVGLTRRKRGEIFDFQVGDSLNYSTNESNTNTNIGTGHRIELSFTDKTLWWPDSVTYKTHITDEKSNFIGSPIPTSVTTLEYDSEMTFYNLDAYVDTHLPSEFWYDSTSNALRYSVLRVDYCGRLVEDLHYIGYIDRLYDWAEVDDTTRECYVGEAFYIDEQNYQYIEGCGGNLFPQFVYYHGTGGPRAGGSINWISNEKGDCGTYLYLGVDTTTVIETPTYFNVYPNPTSDFLTITTEKDEPIWYITLTSMNGDLVSSKFVDDISYQLDCNTFKSGNYLLQVFFINKEPENKLITIVR